MKLGVVALALSAALSFGIVSAANAADITIKVGHGAAEGYHMHKAWLKFKEEIEKNSGNRFEVEIYPNGQVGGDRELTEAVQAGIVDMTCPVIEVMDGWDKNFSIPGLPFIFKDRADALKALNGKFGQMLLDRAGQYGLVGLGYMENGIRQITSNKCPIVKPSDLDGVKLRTMQVQAHMEAFQLMGANPTPMSFNEVYSALQQGVVDAEENPLGHITSSKFYEVQKCMTLTSHVYSTHIVLANPDFYNSLSDADKDLVKQSLATAIDYQQQVIANEEEQQIKDIEAAGVTVTRLTPEQRNEFEKVTAPIREKYLSEADPELIKALNER
ncbi:TRAP transporter substrate-binding protein [Succinatimonas hippei]|uniref:TRAP transporter substrate-binding protein n=1 Tax=Succinatimonas hippei TaxID=626938 RepID=UPI00255CB0A3|nr:TRAP transporter substrate-binding protein [Succinatimonas hippei]